MTGVYGFWKHVSNLDHLESRRYLEMFYALKYRPLVCTLKTLFGNERIKLLSVSNVGIFYCFFVSYRLRLCLLLRRIEEERKDSEPLRSLKREVPVFEE